MMAVRTDTVRITAICTAGSNVNAMAQAPDATRITEHTEQPYNVCGRALGPAR